MTRPRALAALAAALAVAIALTGCSGDPHPTPLTRAQRITLYEQFSQRDWDQLAQLSPSTPRPDLRVKTVSTGGQWALDMAKCLREQGITQFSVTADGAIDLSQSPGFSGGVTSLPQQLCTAQHPNSVWLDYYLSDSQLSVLYDYYVESLEPCLVMHAGATIGRIPTRKRFIEQFYINSWSPYDDQRLVTYQTDKDGRSKPTALLQVCPDLPSWIRR